MTAVHGHFDSLIFGHFDFGEHGDMLYMFMVNFVFDDVQIMEYDVDY